MKKFLITVAVILVVLSGCVGVLLPLLGLSGSDIAANASVGTGVGAKLACSGRYMSDLDEGQIESDLATYTAATNLLSLDYDDQLQRVTASLAGMAVTSAQYRQGLGCSLEIGDTAALDRLRAPQLPPTTGAWPQGEAANELFGPVQAKLEALLLADNASDLQTRALVVAHKGQLVAEVYADGFDHSSMLLGWSMAKSLTAIMLGHLELLGRLSVDEANLFPQWQGDGRAAIRVRHLLQMSSGLDFSEDYAPGSDATAMLFTAHSASDVALASELGHAPGTYFSYSSGTTNILARLLTERLGGSQAAVDFLAYELFKPLGIRHTIMELDASGVFVGSSYVYGSGRDWARLGQLMLNDGELNGVQLLSKDWVARSRMPNGSSNDARYGYQFWLNGGGSELRWPALPEDAYAMSGNRAQTVMIVPSADAVIVRLGWTSGSYPMAENFAELLEVLSHY